MRALLAALIVCAFALPAHAAHRHHGAYRVHIHRVAQARHHVRFSHRWRGHEAHVAGGLTHARLADGQIITVATSYASRFVGFLDALYRREGHLPHIGCYSPTGHMRGSLHHWGGACDVGQQARNVAWRPMYHVRALALEYGLTDGCSWRHPDCGHVDVSGALGRYAGM